MHSVKENTSLFADDTMTPCDFNVIDQHPATEDTNDTNALYHQNHLASTHNENMHTETLSANQPYNIMILTIKTLLHSQTNTQHYYNKNYKIHIGINMIQ